MLMVKTSQRTVREIAEGKGWSFEQYTAYCLLEGIKYDVAYETWHGYKRKHREITKRAIANALRVDEKDIKWND